MTWAMPLAAVGRHVGGPIAAQVGAVFVPAHEDDAFGAEGFGGEYRGEADGAVADDGDDFAGGDFAHVGGVVAGEVDVGSVSRDASSSSLAVSGLMSGTFTMEPSARGMRAYWAWSPPGSGWP